MIGGNLPKRLPPDASPEMMLRAFRQLQEQLEALSRYVNTREVGGTIPTSVPIPPDFIYGQIFDASGSGGSGSGSVSIPGPGFTDSDGITAYAFEEIYSDKPWLGIIVPGGVTTVVPNAGEQGSNFAYPLNGETHDAGENVILRRAREHWVIVGSVGEVGGSGSGSGQTVTVICSDGSKQNFHISGNTATQVE